MGNAQQGKNVNLIKQYNVKPEAIVIDEKNRIYLKQDRSEVKLNQQLLKSFFKANNFSYDVDDEKYK